MLENVFVNDDTLECTLNEKKISLSKDCFYCENNVVKITFAGVLKLANLFGIEFRVENIIKPTWNTCSVLVSARERETNNVVQALVGFNKANVKDGEDVDMLAHEAACTKALFNFLELPNNEFKINHSVHSTEQKPSVNSVVNEDTTPNTPRSVTSNNSVINTEPITDDLDSPATVTMPLGEFYGKTVYSILENGNLKYFEALYIMNKPIRRNRKISDAIFAYYNTHDCTPEEVKILEKIKKILEEK